MLVDQIIFALECLKRFAREMRGYWPNDLAFDCLGRKASVNSERWLAKWLSWQQTWLYPENIACVQWIKPPHNWPWMISNDRERWSTKKIKVCGDSLSAAAAGCSIRLFLLLRQMIWYHQPTDHTFLRPVFRNFLVLNNWLFCRVLIWLNRNRQCNDGQ